MQNYDFNKIKETILEWSKIYLTSNCDFMEVTKNEKEELIFDLTFKNCLAQIVVCNSDFSL